MQYTVYLNTMKHERRLPMRLDQGRPCCYEKVLCQSPGPLEACLLHNPFCLFFGINDFSLALPSFKCQVIKGLIEAQNIFYYFAPAIKFVRWLYPERNIHFQSTRA